MTRFWYNLKNLDLQVKFNARFQVVCASLGHSSSLNYVRSLDEATCMDQPTHKLAPWMVVAPGPKAPLSLQGLPKCDVLRRLQPMFPSLKRHLDSAIK